MEPDTEGSCFRFRLGNLDAQMKGLECGDGCLAANTTFLLFCNI